MVLCGVPRSGKSTFWKRLVDKTFNPQEELSPSTPAAVSYLLSADLCDVKSEVLLDLQLCGDHGALDRQALTIYRKILERSQASGTEGESPSDTKDKSPSNKEDKLHPGTQDKPSSDRMDTSPPDKKDAASSPGKKDESSPSRNNESVPHNNANSAPADDHPDSETHTASPTTDNSPDPVIVEIDKQFQKLKDLLHECKGNIIQSKINKMCHLQDTGGQRAFLELLPTLSVGKALYLLFFNYINFEAMTDEKVLIEGSSEEMSTDTKYKQIDVIMQSLICASTASTEKYKNVALLVGTHVDDPSVKVSDVNDKILKRVNPFLNNTLVYTEKVKHPIGEKEKIEKLVLKVGINKKSLCEDSEHYGDEYCRGRALL